MLRNIKVFSLLLLLLSITGLLCIYTTKYSSITSTTTSNMRFLRNSNSGSKNYSIITDESLILLNNAYWEQMDPSSARIRILAYSKCNSTDNLQLKIGQDSEIVKIKPTTRAVEGDCPWHWAPGCEWNSFIIDSIIDLGKIEYDTLTLYYDNNRLINLPLNKVPDKKNGLAVCVPPLYFYADWLRLSLFIETWKTNGADHFYIYVQSISTSVKSILDIYQKQGIVTIVDWPLLPTSDFEDPNKSVYRLGHSLSHNDCRMRVERKFVALVDLDEFVLPAKTNKTLANYLYQKLKSHPLAGSFLFQHSKLHFPEWPSNGLSDLNFDWIRDAKSEVNPNGPTKAVFLADKADIILTHKVRKHFGIFSEVEILQNEASLYHSRLNWVKKRESTNDHESVIFFNENYDKISKNMRSVISKADDELSSGLNVNNTVVGTLIVRCLSEWQTMGCKTPFHTCYEDVYPVDEWIITNTTDIFTVL